MYPKRRFRAYISNDMGKIMLILSNLAKIIKNWKVLPRAVEGEGGGNVVDLVLKFRLQRYEDF